MAVHFVYLAGNLPRRSTLGTLSREDRASLAGLDPENVLQALMNVHPEPIDPRATEVALMRLRDAPDEELAVFADRLREDALRAGASEQEVRDAQAAHPQR